MYIEAKGISVILKRGKIKKFITEARIKANHSPLYVHLMEDILKIKVRNIQEEIIKRQIWTIISILYIYVFSKVLKKIKFRKTKLEETWNKLKEEMK